MRTISGRRIALSVPFQIRCSFYPALQRMQTDTDAQPSPAQPSIRTRPQCTVGVDRQRNYNGWRKERILRSRRAVTVVVLGQRASTEKDGYGCQAQPSIRTRPQSAVVSTPTLQRMEKGTDT